jgi:tetratricopeptide (TPR) repeat protein
MKSATNPHIFCQPARRSRALSFCLTGLLTFLLSPPLSQAQTKLAETQQTQIATIEENLFFKTYDEEADGARLGRIEKRIFGETSDGDDPQKRLSSILQAAGNLGIKKVPAPGNLPAPPRNSLMSPNQSRQGDGFSPQDSSFSSGSDSQDSAASDSQDNRQARLRVKAAHEMEIKDLQAQACNYWKNKNGPKALECFQKVIRLAPDNAEAHFSLGVILEAQRNYAEAFASYKRAYDLNPDKKDYKEAITTIEGKAKQYQAQAQVKDELRQLAQEAAAAYKRQEYFSALDLYKQLDRKAPKQALVKYNIGTIYLAMNNPVSALEYFSEALKLKPDEPTYQTAVRELSGNLKQEQAERRQAEEQWQSKDNQQTVNTSVGARPTRLSDSNFPDKIADNSADNFKNNKLPGKPGKALPSASLGILVRNGHDGAEISTIGLASRASKVGLLRGDIIKAVDGTVINSAAKLQELLQQKQVGQPIQLLIQRGEKLGQVVL